jgi:hypothetical protein
LIEVTLPPTAVDELVGVGAETTLPHPPPLDGVADCAADVGVVWNGLFVVVDVAVLAAPVIVPEDDDGVVVPRRLTPARASPNDPIISAAAECDDDAAFDVDCDPSAMINKVYALLRYVVWCIKTWGGIGFQLGKRWAHN